MHSKINYYLDKKSTTNNMFINAVEKIFDSDDLKKENLIRYDYVTHTMIALNENLNINDDLKWISYDQYIEFNSIVIKKIKGDIDSNTEDQLINLINRLNIEENSEDITDENKLNNSIESNDDESDNLDNINDLEKENNSFDSNIEIDNPKNIIDLVEIEDSIKSSEKEKELKDSENNMCFKKSLKDRLKDKAQLKNININIIDNIFKNINEKEGKISNNINILIIIKYYNSIIY